MPRYTADAFNEMTTLAAHGARPSTRCWAAGMIPQPPAPHSTAATSVPTVDPWANGSATSPRASRPSDPLMPTAEP